MRNKPEDRIRRPKEIRRPKTGEDVSRLTSIGAGTTKKFGDVEVVPTAGPLGMLFFLERANACDKSISIPRFARAPLCGRTVLFLKWAYPKRGRKGSMKNISFNRPLKSKLQLLLLLCSLSAAAQTQVPVIL